MTSKNRFLAACAFALALLGFVRGGAQAGTPGIDGAKTITAAGTVVNGYDYLISATAGTRTITVNNIANLSPAGLTALGPGSVVLLYQANGATIDDTDTQPTSTSGYGNVTNGNNAGYYEFVTVGSVSGNTITISSACNVLQHTYTTSGATGSSEAEIVRVPQYSSLTINSGASITAPAWSATEVTASGSVNYGSPISIGGYGGIVAVDVAGTTTINGSINVTGGGFLGGDGYQNQGYSAPPGAGTAHMHTQPITDTVFSGETGGDLQTALAGMKGESIAGNQATLDANFVSRYGRGAPANGGGGANGHNTGGGGGSNGNNGNTYYGVGLLDTNYTAYYSNSNGNNPTGTYDSGGFSANGVALAGTPMSVDSGGGRGGYSFGVPSNNPPIVPTNVGGFGGRPLGATANSRIFFGGGGGAGDENDGSGGYGGNGGGIVIINTGALAGSGSIVANGSPGGVPNSSDGAGGGGGGGSVVVLSGSGSVATITANGGAGGNMAHSGGPDDEGTGGGGGGGFVAASASTISVAGGAEGMLTAPAPFNTTFPPFGATLGTAGATTAAPTSFTYCYTPVIGVAKAATVTNNKNGTYTVAYTVYYQNYGDTPLATFTSTDALTSTFPTGTFTVSTPPALSSISSGSTATVDTGFNGNADPNLITAGTLAVGGTAVVTFSVTITPPVGSQTYNNTAIGNAKGVTGNSSGVTTTDQSDSGTNPDPAGLGNPGSENTPTSITITGQPTIVKTVRNVTTNEATGLTADTAKPGDQLEYTLSFTNGTGGALSGFVLTDLIPTNTTYKSSACGALATGVTACTAVYSAPGTGFPNGKVTYTLTGSIGNAATQTFTLDVTVN